MLLNMLHLHNKKFKNFLHVKYSSTCAEYKCTVPLDFTSLLVVLIPLPA
jgi:hypothetical protein